MKTLFGITPKILFYVSLCVIGYFCLLCMNAYIIKSNFFLIGVLQEILTLPLLFIQFVLLFVSMQYCFNDKFKIKSYSLWTFILLLISNFYFLGSFIISF